MNGREWPVDLSIVSILTVYTYLLMDRKEGTSFFWCKQTGHCGESREQAHSMVWVFDAM
jgi:hypothetical protein